MKNKKNARQEPDVLIKASPAAYDQLLQQINKSASPGPKLQALVRRDPAWKK